jgi:nucleoside 2-deoxyribosyltransferase
MHVYLCGGINGLTDDECKNWREYAKEKLGDSFVCLDPMRRDYRGIEDDHVEEIVESDYLDIDDADVILANACKPSWGTAMEIHESYNRRIPVIAVCDSERVSPWLRYHCKVILATLDEAIDYIKEHKYLEEDN